VSGALIDLGGVPAPGITHLAYHRPGKHCCGNAAVALISQLRGLKSLELVGWEGATDLSPPRPLPLERLVCSPYVTLLDVIRPDSPLKSIAVTFFTVKFRDGVALSSEHVVARGFTAEKDAVACVGEVLLELPSLEAFGSSCVAGWSWAANLCSQYPQSWQAATVDGRLLFMR